MLIPRHWATARVEGKTPKGRRRVAMRYGWSDESAEAARAHAQSRAEEAMRRIASGEAPVAWRDRADGYGEDGVPIREEVLEAHGPEVVTRNGYGARCLNTPDVLFADVDLAADDRRVSLLLPAVAAGTAAAGILAVRGLCVSGVVMAGVAGLVAFIAGLAVSAMMSSRRAKLLAATLPVRRARVMAALANQFGESDAVRLRVYETPAGIRLAAEHALYAPDSPETSAFFAGVAADRKFVRLCALQQCFRARLTAKPWRCGLSGRNRPGTGRWPETDEAKRAEREAWVRRYERAASAYSACSLVASFGKAPSHPRAKAVLDLHDRLSGATSGLPTA